VAERWLPVVGYEGSYEVSDIGRVRSLERVVTFKDGRRRTIRACTLRLRSQKSGHLYVTLCKSGTTKHHRVHRLVLAAHYGPPSEGQVARHLDGNPKNNVLGNLAWGSVQENTRDTVRHGHHHLTMRAECPRGHKLEAPNLVAYEAKQGHRKCKACHRGRSRCVKDNNLSPERMQANSDWQYMRIMEGE